MTKNNLPYKECASCKTIGDCPHPDVAEDFMGSVMPPECCPVPISVMKETLKLRKKLRKNEVV